MFRVLRTWGQAYLNRLVKKKKYFGPGWVSLEGNIEEGLEEVKGFVHMNISRMGAQAAQRLCNQECSLCLRNIKEAQMAGTQGAR